jgi:hypothetical protein
VRLPNIFGFNMKITKETEYFVFVHYLSKWLDLLDTVFICLKKNERQLIFLHVYHHATIGQIWGLLLYIGWGGGTALFGANINSFVHVSSLSSFLLHKTLTCVRMITCASWPFLLHMILP